METEVSRPQVSATGLHPDSRVSIQHPPHSISINYTLCIVNEAPLKDIRYRLCNKTRQLRLMK